jgi:hypothetical protein
MEGMPIPQHSVPVHVVGRQLSKTKCKGTKHLTLNFGREGKFEQMKLFPAVSLFESIRERKNQLLHLTLSVGSQVNLRRDFLVHAKKNFCIFVLCCNLRNNLRINIFKFMGHDYAILR